MSQPMLEIAIKSLISEGLDPGKALKVADLGCGVGPVPLALVSLVKENVKRECEKLSWDDHDDDDDQMPEIQIYMNDLPSNDFNLLFRDLLRMEEEKGEDVEGKSSKLPMCFLMGAPGSFYERLFPKESLHLVHANCTLHWLSQAPSGLYSPEGKGINKGTIYISETSPREVGKAYLGQFERDLTQFLKCRSQEVVPNGLMLLTFRGRPSSSDLATWHPWELKLLSLSISSLVSKGMLEEEKVDTFDFPYFGATKEEIQSIVEGQGSFAVENMKTVTHSVANEIECNMEKAEKIGKFVRAFTQPLLSRYFGVQVLGSLYDELTRLTLHHLDDGQPADRFIIIVLLRRI